MKFKKMDVSVHKYAFILGKIMGYLENLNNISVLPSFRNEYLKGKIARGIHAVLAREGSEVSLEQIEQIQAGNSLPAGKIFLEEQIKRMVNEANDLFIKIKLENKLPEITADYIRKMNLAVSGNIEKGEDALYLHEQDEWLHPFCEWLQSEIVPIYPEPGVTAVIKAVLIHFYFEWMQPFGTANTKTSQMLELAILLKGGMPYIVSYILPVYYYETRTEHQRRMELVKKSETPNDFIEYALQGFCDGLEDVITTLQAQQFNITWRHYILTVLMQDNDSAAKVIARRTDLMLAFPLNIENGLKFEDVLILTPAIARLYAKSAKTARRDLSALVDLGLLTKNKTKYYPNVTAILGEMALKSSLIRLEQFIKKEIKYSHHVLPRVSAMELKSELLQTLNELNSGNR